MIRIELTEEELKLLSMCVADKESKMFANCFDSEIPNDMKKRCKELYQQCNVLRVKLEDIRKRN